MVKEKITLPVKINNILISLLKLLALAIIYHLAVRLGLMMAYVQPNTSPVWPPTGIAIAALLLFGTNLWPGISAGVLLGSLLTGAPFNLAIGMTLGNTLEALAIAYFLKRLVNFHTDISRVQDVIYLLIGSFFGTMISASVGTLTLMLTDLGEWEFFQTIWTTWWIGDLLGALVITPVLLVWFKHPPFLTRRSIYIESTLQLTFLGLITWYVFSNQPPGGVYHQALLYVIFPFMIWAALRLGQRGATTAILLVSGIAIWGTVEGMGPFSMESKNDSLILLQTFMGVVSLTMLILAGATIERRKAIEALHQRIDDLAILNDSSKTFLDNFEITRMYQTICQLAVERLGCNVAWVETTNQVATIAGYFGEPQSKVLALKDIWEKGVNFTQLDNLFVRSFADLPETEGDFQSFAAFPLIFGGNSIGMLKVLSRDKQFFSEERLPLIQSFANLAAVAIQNTLLFGEVQVSNRQLHALSHRLIKAQEEERLHLSREIHDESGQMLTAMTFQLGLLEREAGDIEIVNQRMAELKRTANEIQSNLHQLAVNLRPASLDHLGLVTALQQYVEEFSRQYDIDFEFEAVGMQGKRLSGEVETALFRIIQESLTNVVLHAQAKRVDVLLNIRNNHVIANIEDDGVGFTPTGPFVENHLGLFGMHERVEMLTGKLTIESEPGKGTTVHVEVPCDD
jgi:signal transduction histidine kinase